MTDTTESEDFRSVKEWFAAGSNPEWTDYNADAKKGEKKGEQDWGTVVTRSGLPPLSESELRRLWYLRRKDPSAQQAGIAGLCAWIEQRCERWFNQYVRKHRAGLDIDDAVGLGYAIAAEAFSLKRRNKKKKRKGCPKDGRNIHRYVMRTLNGELKHLIGDRRTVGRKEKSDTAEAKAGLGGAFYLDGQPDESDMRELILHLCPKLGDDPNAVKILYYGRKRGKKLKDIAERLGVPKRDVSEAVSKWGQAVFDVLGLRWKRPKKSKK